MTLAARIVLALAALAVLAGLGLAVYSKWFLLQALSERPYIQTTLLPDPGPGQRLVEFKLTGSNRTFRLERFTAQDPESLQISLPAGFVVQNYEESEPGEVNWAPAEPFYFEPERPIQLLVSFDPEAQGTVSLLGFAEASLGLGGTGCLLKVPIGQQSPAEIEYFNLYNDLNARSAREGKARTELPGWKRLQELRPPR